MKRLSEFYRHPQMADGRLGKCKECCKKDVAGNYRRNIEHYKTYERKRANLPHRIKARSAYSKTESGKLSHRKSQRKWIELNLIKRAAHIMVGNAIRDGKLHKKPCEVCGHYKVDAHHEDYSKPLDVRWLCRKHHLQEHGKVS